MKYRSLFQLTASYAIALWLQSCDTMKSAGDSISSIPEENSQSDNQETYTFSTALDSDRDGLSDETEQTLHLSPVNRDSDGDSMDDGWETYYSSQISKNDLKPEDDLDDDGIDNLDEYLIGTNPILNDSNYASIQKSKDGIFDIRWFGVSKLPYRIEIRNPSDGVWKHYKSVFGEDREISLKISDHSDWSNLDYRFINSKIYIYESNSPIDLSRKSQQSFQIFKINTTEDPGSLDKLIASFRQPGERTLAFEDQLNEFLPAVIRLSSGYFYIRGNYSLRPIDKNKMKLKDWIVEPKGIVLESNWSIRGEKSKTIMAVDFRQPHFSTADPIDVAYNTMIEGVELFGNLSANHYHNQKVLDLEVHGSFSKLNRNPIVQPSHPIKFSSHGISIYGAYSSIERVIFRDFGTDHFGTAPVKGEAWEKPFTDPPGESYPAAIRGPILRNQEQGSYFGSRISGCKYIGPVAYGIPKDHEGLTTIFMISGGMKNPWFDTPNNRFHYLEGAELIQNSCLISNDPKHLETGEISGNENAQFSIDGLKSNHAQCLSMYQVDGGRIEKNRTLNTRTSVFADTAKAKNISIIDNSFFDTNEGIRFFVGELPSTGYENLDISRNIIKFNIENDSSHRWGAGIGLSTAFHPDSSLTSLDETDYYYRGIRDIKIDSNQILISEKSDPAIQATSCSVDWLGIYLSGISGKVIVTNNIIDSDIPKFQKTKNICNSADIRISQLELKKDGQILVTRKTTTDQTTICGNFSSLGDDILFLRIWNFNYDISNPAKTLKSFSEESWQAPKICKF